MLGVIRQAFSRFNSITTKAKLYTALVRSQLTYCSVIWHPYLIQDINKLESIQCRATKFIMNNYKSDYKTRLLHLNLLSLMYIFESTDIIFLVKSLKFPSESFNINNYVSFSAGSATRSSGVKLIHKSLSTSKQRNHYFIRICHLWNLIPILDLNMPVPIIKNHLKTYFWNHFIANLTHLKFPLFISFVHAAVVIMILHPQISPNYVLNSYIMDS